MGKIVKIDLTTKTISEYPFSDKERELFVGGKIMAAKIIYDNIKEKIDPYLMPIYDALDIILGHDQKEKLLEKGTIEVIPLAYMRGRTLDNAYIILDEAQTTTPAQMKMFLTRIGFGSKVIITGDASQKDLAPGSRSGLDVATKVLSRIDDIAFCNLTSKDVVRHPLVQKIVKAYDDFEAKEKIRSRERHGKKQ